MGRRITVIGKVDDVDAALIEARLAEPDRILLIRDTTPDGREISGGAFTLIECPHWFTGDKTIAEAIDEARVHADVDFLVRLVEAIAPTSPEVIDHLAAWLQDPPKRSKGRRPDVKARADKALAERAVRALCSRREASGCKVSLSKAAEEVAERLGIEPERLAGYVNQSSNKKRCRRRRKKS
jgi:hypothetical protein